MVIKKDSLKISLSGDWNKFYIQPEWIGEHVFEKDEFELIAYGQGVDCRMSYRSDGVIILPAQEHMIFFTTDMESKTLDYLCGCVSNFVKKVDTPVYFDYELNADFVEDDGLLFAEILDSMSDTDAILENGYEIVSTTVSRTFKNNDQIINMDSRLENKKLYVHFNEQYHDLKEDDWNFNTEDITHFIEECKKIVCKMGYEIEGDE